MVNAFRKINHFPDINNVVTNSEKKKKKKISLKALYSRTYMYGPHQLVLRLDGEAIVSKIHKSLLYNFERLPIVFNTSAL